MEKILLCLEKRGKCERIKENLLSTEVIVVKTCEMFREKLLRNELPFASSKRRVYLTFQKTPDRKIKA